MAARAGLSWSAARLRRAFAAKFPCEQALGLVVLDVKVAAHPSEAIGLSQFLPALGAIDGSVKLFGVDEGLDQHDRMPVAGLPVGAQTIQRQPKRTGSQIGKRSVRQQQEAAIVDNQRQPSSALLLTPANPAVPRAQPARGGAKDQDPQPIATTLGHGIEELLTHGADIAQIMVSGQAAASPGLILDGREQLDLHISQRG